MGINAELIAVADGITASIKTFVGTQLLSIRQRLDTVAHRMDGVEQRTIALGKRGIGVYRHAWTADATYAAGDLVTFNGAMWHAEGASKGAKPPGPSWKLAVRKGDVGPQGVRGDTGAIPEHRWVDGTKLQFQQGPDGDTWGEAVDLEGPRGKDGVTQVIAAPGLGFAAPTNAYFPQGW